MIYDDALVLESLLLLVMITYLTTINLTTLLFSAGLYLLLLGLLLLSNDADIYVGFLWVIDLGVGLVFFLFVVHFTAFMHQKSNLNLSDRHYVLVPVVVGVCAIVLYAGSLGGQQSHYADLAKTWAFRVTHLDYFTVWSTNEVTELNTIRDAYFFLNTFEFFAVNFSLFYGLMASILTCFSIQRIFIFLSATQVLNYSL